MILTCFYSPAADSEDETLIVDQDDLRQDDHEDTSEDPDDRSARIITSIHALPGELLLAIFAFYAESLNPFATASYKSSTGPAYTLNTRHGQYWAPLMLVCRFWRSLILTTPSLWNEIVIGKQAHWLKLALLRSQRMPLTLIFHANCYSSARAAVALLLPHARRIRRLYLPTTALRNDYDKVTFPFFLPLLRKRMINLEELAFPGTTVNPHSSDFAVAPLSATRLPALRILRLPGFAIPWSPDIVSRLRCLHLDTTLALPPAMSHARFLDVLSCCQDMEELRLLDGFVGCAVFNRRDPKDQRTIHLPKLRLFVLDDEPVITSWLLSRVRPREFCSYHVIGYTVVGSAVPPGNMCHALLPPRSKAGQSPIPLKSDVKRIVITTCDHVFKVDFCGTDALRPLLTVELLSRNGFPWMSHVCPALAEVSDLMAGAPIEALQINAHSGFDRSVNVEVFGRFLVQFPQVRDLTVAVPIFPYALCSALGDAYVDNFGPPNPSASGYRGPPVCPCLRRFRLEDVFYDTTAARRVADVLSRRATLGLAKLESVAILFQLDKNRPLMFLGPLRRELEPYVDGEVMIEVLL
ncbi:hypothetical protein BD413DRAFT_312492 [Trametes elegans]|nr:hypothetical protein BD413DRAFT_312492 [Trametes elegans]